MKKYGYDPMKKYGYDPMNKLAKARKMRKPPGTLSLKKFGPGNIWIENVWTQNTLPKISL